MKRKLDQSFLIHALDRCLLAGPLRAFWGCCFVAMAASSTWGQAPTTEELPPQPIPGSMTPRLGIPPGSGGNVLGTNPGAGEQILSGRPGASTPRVPTNITAPPPAAAPRSLLTAPLQRSQMNIPNFYGPLAMPRTGEEVGPENGLTLDLAIEALLRENLDLKSKWYEIPQARADVLTASLRVNPLFFWDTQLNPYGNYSQQRPGGQPQIDVNISYPIDYSGKRKARIAVAEPAVKVLEMLFQDAVRMKIDTLYAAYLNALQARETIRYAQTSLENLNRLYDLTYKKYKRGFSDVNKMVTSRSEVQRILHQRELAATGVEDAQAAYQASKRVLGGLLNLHPDQAETIELRASLLPRLPALPTAQELEAVALEHRPDLKAALAGIPRAEADLRLAKANRFQDLYLLLQPYTFQNNTYLGVKSATSYAFGMTVPLPIYNRNQGNVLRTTLNIPQTKIEAEMTARQVEVDVRQAIAEYTAARNALARMEKTIVPAAKQAYDDGQKLFEGGEIEVSQLLNILNEYVNVGRQRIDSTVRMRRAMFMLNTAVGVRLAP